MKYTAGTVGQCSVTDVVTAVQKMPFTIKYPKIDLNEFTPAVPNPHLHAAH
jgi:hypothetical protein